ncbi:hypothetical protein BDN71DRAFT_653770 [Pleurotus eryngii]|uniref:Uncharacterized protein n=1 Tax=Pleurotus eryngii TaxID=5323 RepID=A0A9P6DGP7_PLEER|nr:hypothetical protein BDN71DRAFT_653770 [Pleurotus eryngii]
MQCKISIRHIKRYLAQRGGHMWFSRPSTYRFLVVGIASLRDEMYSINTLSSISGIFATLHTLPRLKPVDFAFHIAFGPEVAAFLNAHAEIIEELKLAAYRPAKAAPFSIAELRLPLLRNLFLEWDRFGPWNNDVPHRQLWAPGGDLRMPERLEITSICIDVDHLALFCNLFKHSSGDRLRYLELPCRTTSANTFDSLSEAFPNLRTPVLPTLYLSNPSVSDPKWKIEAFAAEMGYRAYHAWTLCMISKSHLHFLMHFSPCYDLRTESCE